MKRKINAALKADKTCLTAEVGKQIVAELAKGDVQEAFRNLKGWYRKAGEMQARPCRQTMEGQTDERVALYVEGAAHGAEFPANRTLFIIGDSQPTEGKLQAAVSQMTQGRAPGALGICAEHIKAWLHGAKKEEDPETRANHINAKKTWSSLLTSVPPFCQGPREGNRPLVGGHCLTPQPPWMPRWVRHGNRDHQSQAGSAAGAFGANVFLWCLH